MWNTSVANIKMDYHHKKIAGPHLKFNRNGKVSFSHATFEHVSSAKLYIYTISGRLVHKTVNENLPGTEQTLDFRHPVNLAKEHTFTALKQGTEFFRGRLTSDISDQDQISFLYRHILHLHEPASEGKIQEIRITKGLKQ